MRQKKEIRVSPEVKILVSRIRVFPGQPREEFDEEDMNGLAASIKEVGLQQPITVKLVTDDPNYDFELIDGERRLRAHKLLNYKEILAFIRQIGSDFEQYVKSVASNFCRSPHTPLETAHALKKIVDWFVKNGERDSVAIDKAGRICGRSSSWVYQHIGLLKLCPGVQVLIKEKKLMFPIGVALSNLTHKAQVSFAAEIIDRELGYKKALAYIREHRNKHLTENARIRTSADDFSRIVKFLKHLREESEISLDFSFVKLKEILNSRDPKETEKLIKMIDREINSLNGFKTALCEIQSGVSVRAAS